MGFESFENSQPKRPSFSTTSANSYMDKYNEMIVTEEIQNKIKYSLYAVY